MHIWGLTSVVPPTLTWGCGARPLTLEERQVVESQIQTKSEALIGSGKLPRRAPLQTIELVRTLLEAHQLSTPYLSSFITRSDLRSQSVRRLGEGRVGDLVVFRDLPRALSFAVITHVFTAKIGRAHV